MLRLVIGTIPAWMGFVRWLITGMAVFTRYVMLFLAAKGYGLVRTRLAAVEWRTVYSVAGFLAVGEILYRYIGAGAMVSPIRFSQLMNLICLTRNILLISWSR